jgi:hypothetical protein
MFLRDYLSPLAARKFLFSLTERDVRSIVYSIWYNRNNQRVYRVKWR